jgi:hypothetical protein
MLLVVSSEEWREWVRYRSLCVRLRNEFFEILKVNLVRVRNLFGRKADIVMD